MLVYRFAKPRRRPTSNQLLGGGGGPISGALAHLGVKHIELAIAIATSYQMCRAELSPESDS